MSHLHPSPERAVSLLEILIGITILAMAMGPLYLLFRQASRAAGDESRTIQAVFLAQKVLAEIKAEARRQPSSVHFLPLEIPFEVVRRSTFDGPGAGMPEFLRSIHGPGRPVDPASPYFGSMQPFRVTISPGPSPNERVWLQVEVAWQEGGKARRIALTGLVDPTPDAFHEAAE